METLRELETKLLQFRYIDGDCWRWRRCRRSGYGVVTYNHRTIDVHRAAAAIYLGLDLNNSSSWACHKCRNRDCFNPEHLYVGTAYSNTIDSVADRTHWFSVKSTCKMGHLYTDENTIRERDRRGKVIRRCRICHTAKIQRWRNKRRTQCTKTSQE